ncbi:Universal stress protein family protein [Jeotgalicoccus saudimassiliensis]|uniref:Universal stress protein family protein n=1 Tax=Jeotgalicoccus saudimassiliensis TaxID=1461582 RepID=A0A078MBM8_9STAP|nr:universal stress protein [Jeotgalicoccus saudimassiliensis]CEA02096.1 Universal stress protein family protein [Jeotgalicoccus saudimassiliensis]
MYKSILVPFDFGNSFDNVPAQLAKLTNGSKESTITIFNVITENEMADNVKYQGKHFDDIAKERVGNMQFFTEQLDEYGLNYKIYFGTGRVIAELKKEIESNEYELVVMSNKRSKRTLKHVLGHVTHKVAKRANIPVMIIK